MPNLLARLYLSKRVQEIPVSHARVNSPKTDSTSARRVDKAQQSLIDSLRIRAAKEMCTTVDNLQPGIWQQFNLFFGISHTIHGIRSPMQPQNRTLNIRKSQMKPTPLHEVNSSHTNAQPPLIPPIIVPNRSAPELAHLRSTVIKPNRNQRIAVLNLRLEIGRRRIRRPLLHKWRQEPSAIPAS